MPPRMVDTRPPFACSLSAAPWDAGGAVSVPLMCGGLGCSIIIAVSGGAALLLPPCAGMDERVVGQVQLLVLARQPIMLVHVLFVL